MAENTGVEEPTVEEPTVTEPIVKEPTPDEAREALLAELKAFKIDTPEDIKGMATASAQAGNYANILGDRNQKIEELERAIGVLQNQTSSVTEPEYGESVDLKKLVRGEIRGFYQDEIVKPQQEANAAYYRDMNKIQNDSKYKVVQKAWEAHYNNSTTQQKIVSGQTGIYDEYLRVKDMYVDELLKRTESYMAQSPKVKPPHVETGNTQSIQLPTEDDEMTAKIKKQTDRANWQGTDQDVLSLVKTLLPADSAIFK